MTVREVLHMKSGGEQTIMTPFADWCEHRKVDAFQLLGDIEEMCVMMTGQGREDWTEHEHAAYDKVRTRILNLAGAVARQPQNQEG